MSSDDELYGLTVSGIERETRDSVVVALEVPRAFREAFRYRPGQYLMVRVPWGDGEDDFRSYSVCQAPPADGSAPSSLRIGVRQLGSGGFSEFANVKLAVGDSLRVLPPAGRFRLREAPRHLGVAAGSGITPVLAIAEAALARGERFTLLYGNRTRDSLMFAGRLAELERRHGPRFIVLRVFSREPQADPLLHGRIDGDRLPVLMDAAGVDAADDELQHYLCGPAGLVSDARAYLVGAGAERRRVHAELFAAAPFPPQG